MIGRMWTAATALAASPLLWALILSGVLIGAGMLVQWVTAHRG